LRAYYKKGWHSKSVSSKSTSNTWTFTETKPGTYTYKGYVYGKKANGARETLTTNTITVKVLAEEDKEVEVKKADLEITSFYFSNSSPKVGSTIYGYATVRNSGKVRARNIYVSMVDQKGWGNTSRISSLYPNRATKVRLKLKVTDNHTTYSPHNFVITADSKKTVDESNEENNVATAELVVLGSQVIKEDPVSGTLSVYKSTVKVGEEILLTVAGKDDNGITKIMAFYGGKWHEKLVAGGPTTNTWTFTETKPGTYTYRGYVYGKKANGAREAAYASPKSVRVKVTEETIELSCKDSDDDKDYYTKGIAQGYPDTVQGSTYDCCKNSMSGGPCVSSAPYLSEALCDGTTPSSTMYDCPNGCQNGACLKAESEITLISPNGGEEFKGGEAYDIKWKSNGVDNVMIELQNGNNGEHLTYKTPASSGKYTWKTSNSQKLSSNYKIAIWDSNNTEIKDESDNYFSFVAVSAEDKVSGTISAEKDVVTVGEDIKITVSAQDDNGLTKVWSRHKNKWNSVNAEGTSFSYTWTFSEARAGTYTYYGYVYGKKKSGSRESAYASPRTITVKVVDKPDDTKYPDLTIGDIYFLKGGRLGYKAENVGNMHVLTSSYVSLDVNEKQVEIDSMSVMPMYSDIEASFNTEMFSEGEEYKLKVCADHKGTISESNEDNNCLSKTLTYPKKAIPVITNFEISAVTGYSIIPDEIPYNQKFTVSWESSSVSAFCKGYGDFIPAVDGGLWNTADNENGLSSSGSKVLYARHSSLGHKENLKLELYCYDNHGISSEKKEIIIKVKPPCSETDDGKDYYNIGTITGQPSNYYSDNVGTDYCSGPYLREFYCKGDSIYIDDYICPGGCEKGVCLQDNRDVIDCGQEFKDNSWCASKEIWEEECSGKGFAKQLSASSICKSGNNYYDYCVTCEEEEEKSLTISHPNGDEKWDMGDKKWIFWTNKSVDKVDIMLERWDNVGAGGPQTWVLARDVVSEGGWNWTIGTHNNEHQTDISPGQYMIYIQDSSDKTIYDRSDVNFIISDTEAEIEDIVTGSIKAESYYVNTGDDIKLTVSAQDDNGLTKVWALYQGRWRSANASGPDANHTWTFSENKPGTYTYKGYMYGTKLGGARERAYTNPKSITVTVIDKDVDEDIEEEEVIDGARPDLTVTDVYFSAKYPKVGETLYGYVTIKNIGDVTASNIGVLLNDQKGWGNAATITSLRPDESEKVTLTLSVNDIHTTYKHDFAARVDQSNKIIESNEDNNRKEISLIVADEDGAIGHQSIERNLASIETILKSLLKQIGDLK